MNDGQNAASRLSSLLLVFLLCCLISAGCGSGPRYTEETIHRLNRAASSQTGRAVILHGTTANPLQPGEVGEGALGSYLLLDSGGLAVRILARQPPRAGIACRVSGLVGQNPENALQPVVLETRRSRPHRDLLMILALLFLAVGSLPLATVRAARSRAVSREEPDAPRPPPRPGTDCILDLEVVAGPDMGRRHSFREDLILVGRPGLRQNDLSLEDQTVSRNQAVIVRDEKLGGFKIRNEGRTNPLKLNGRPCDAVALRHGDLLTVGLTTLKVSYRQPPSVEKNPPVLLLCLLFSLLAGSPGSVGAATITLEQLNLMDLPQVACRFQVAGDHGGLRMGLGPGDFRLLVDGRPPVDFEMRSHLAPGQQPLQLVLVAQVSREDRGRGLFLLKSVVEQLLQRLPEATQSALVSHGAGSRLEQGFTSDRHLFLSRLEAMRLDQADGSGSYYQALELASELFEPVDNNPAAVVYLCRAGQFTRKDMRPEAPKGLRVRPEIPIYPVLLPERDGSRTTAYLRQLSLKLTAGFTGHYTLSYQSPGGEDNRVHSLRIDRISSSTGTNGAACRYRAVAGMGLETEAVLGAEDRRNVFDHLVGLLFGLAAGGLAFRWVVGSRSWARERSLVWLRVHYLLAAAVAGVLVSLLADRVF